MADRYLKDGESRTAAVKAVLLTHCQENRLQVKYPRSDGREVLTVWQRWKHRYDAKRKQRRPA